MNIIHRSGSIDHASLCIQTQMVHLSAYHYKWKFEQLFCILLNAYWKSCSWSLVVCCDRQKKPGCFVSGSPHGARRVFTNDGGRGGSKSIGESFKILVTFFNACNGDKSISSKQWMLLKGSLANRFLRCESRCEYCQRPMQAAEFGGEGRWSLCDKLGRSSGLIDRLPVIHIHT